MREIDKIILHHSLTKDSKTVSWNAIRRFHTVECGWSDIGYHYGIELVGDHYEILVGRPLIRTGAHTYGFNRGSIGICVVGNFDLISPPQNQWSLCIQLVEDLMTIFKISKKNVFGHTEFNSHKSCPGKRFDLDAFRICLGN